ncbi:MAG: ATP-binding protein [Negativicutes bacterium]|nr:ATP-binding protein [Negativicutes bacterium]
MASRLNFSDMFARHMAWSALLVGMAIAVMMPATYFFMAWRDFQDDAQIHGSLIAAKIQMQVRESPDFWYYNVTKFIEVADQTSLQPEIAAISIYDKNATLRYTQQLKADRPFTFPFRIPVRYNNENYGYIDLYESASDIICDTLILSIVFGLIGAAAGIFLYKYPVHIVRLAERGVQSHAHQAQLQAESQVARLDRLRLIGQMAASIGHEVRNPLTTVKGYLQLYARRQEYADSAPQFQLMIDELDRANGIITEFLSLAHNKAIAMQDCNLNSVIEALQPLIQSDALMRGLAIDVELKEVPNIHLDENEIRQLVLNITRNGLESMEPGGRLTIKTGLGPDCVILSIADQGKGIDPDLLPKLGTPFLTTKETGTGLGLAISYSIAHRHNATIDFVTGSSGTTCVILFPLPS